MINLDYHAESVWQALSLSRFHVHIEEVKRVLMPVLEEVYQNGRNVGIADQVNRLSPDSVKEEIHNEVIPETAG